MLKNLDANFLEETVRFLLIIIYLWFLYIYIDSTPNINKFGRLQIQFLGKKIIDDRIKTGFTGFTNKSSLPIFRILPFLTNAIIIRSYRAISYVWVYLILSFVFICLFCETLNKFNHILASSKNGILTTCMICNFAKFMLKDEL